MSSPFRPSVRDVVEQSQRNVPRIIDHLPAGMMVTDPAGETVKGRIIVSGGEVLLEPVRAPVLYPALAQIHARYRGEVDLIVQTTGDRLSERILDELLARNVGMVSISGFDSYHAGINRADRARALRDKLLAMFEAAGVREATGRPTGNDSPPVFNIVGANEDTWIGRLWPRGRAWKNGLSRAGMDDSFCNVWSGGRDRRSPSNRPGMSTPVAARRACPSAISLTNASMTSSTVCEAINRGQPEMTGHAFGWTTERVGAESGIDTPQGRPCRNLCIGCDRFHEKVLGPMIEKTRQERDGRA